MNTHEFHDYFEAGRRDFSDEDLKNVDLAWKDLSQVSFERADLSQANLSSANLTDANLKDAILAFSNLSGANLSGANIQGAVLEGANLSQVIWTAVFYDQNTQFPHGISAETIETDRLTSNKTPFISASPDCHQDQKKAQARQELDDAKRMHAEAEALRKKADKIKKQAESDIKAAQEKTNHVKQPNQQTSKAHNHLPVSLERLRSLASLQKRIKNFSPDDVVKKIQVVADQATQSIRSNTSNLVKSQEASSRSFASEEDILTAEIIEEERPSVPPPFIPASSTSPPYSPWKVMHTLASARHLRMTLSLDDQYLAVGQTDSNLELWKIDQDTFHPWFSFIGQKNGIYGLAFSPDNSLIASGAGDGKITIWKLESKALHNTLCPSTYKREEASHNHKLFQIYNPGIFIHGYRVSVSAIAFSPKGNHLVAGYADGTLRRWDVNHGTLLKETKLHGAPITQVKYSANGELLITSGMDQTLKVVHPDIWKVFHSQHYENSWPCDCVITPDHQFAIAGLSNGHIHIWNLDQGKLQSYISNAHTPGLLDLHLCPNSRLVSVGQDHFLKIWNWKNGQMVSVQSGAYPSSLSSSTKLLAVTGENYKINLLQKIP